MSTFIFVPGEGMTLSLHQCSCCESYLEKTDVSHLLFDVFRKWEAHGVALSRDTWADYPDNILLTLHQCMTCGFGVFLPLTTGSEAFYIDITRNEYYLMDRWDFHAAIKALRLTKARSVLDVGCGQGAFLEMVTKQLPNVMCHGADVNPAIRDTLPKGVKLHIHLSDAPVGFDAVTFFQVIEHVADPVRLLKECIAKVNPGGMVMVSVPDHSGPVRFFADSHTAIPPHHVSIWTPESLNSLLNRLGLNVLEKKREPLPDYLMPFYLPKILSKKFGLNSLKGEGMVKRYCADPVVHLCQKLKIKYLPLRGHTYLAVAQKRG